MSKFNLRFDTNYDGTYKLVIPIANNFQVNKSYPEMEVLKGKDIKIGLDKKQLIELKSKIEEILSK
jgi:hypothetical protein